MNKHFTSRGYVDTSELLSGSGEAIDFVNIPPFLRVLLSTDGTVTKSIESFFWEPVSVVNLGQKPIYLGSDVSHIEKRAGDQVLKREVQLCGEKTQNIYVHATSLICVDLLPIDIQQDLEQGRVGIGEILRECGLETYRQIMAYGRKNRDDGSEAIWRTYRIVMRHKPLIQITEHFPVKIYQ